MLAARGVPVFDADAAVHDSYQHGQTGAEAVARLFGRAVLDASGSVDREALAARVLDDRDARIALEAAIHPLVRKAIESWLDSVDTAIAVIEAALLVETGSWRSYDALVVVWCEPDQQFNRAIVRGVPKDRVRRLRAAQLGIDQKTRVADVVVDNRGDLSELRVEVDRAWSEILEHCAERPQSGNS
jgi:dephospho-CoA kinase